MAVLFLRKHETLKRKGEIQEGASPRTVMLWEITVLL